MAGPRLQHSVEVAEQLGDEELLEHGRAEVSGRAGAHESVDERALGVRDLWMHAAGEAV